MKRRWLHVAAFNLSLVLRREIGVGTPRGLQDLVNRLFFCFCACLGGSGKPRGKLVSAASDFCGPISDAPAPKFAPVRRLEKQHFYHGLLGDECLNGELFYRLKEAQIVIEQWRQQYNCGPTSCLGLCLRRQGPIPLS